ncbi:hypothetical protein U8335_01205 [Roseiconus lacunae]|uniref:hypothetical protein n=1 Tax=Roseiconus lacunae TaxID=2605694 RepID=UPI003092FD82|nr:hypothetical protein U8335_01205 [Stieleria sp. HD01]
MSDYGNQPGGGFSSVDGYNDLAGSQAEEQQRMLQDEMNRQRLEQEANDAAMIQAEQQAAQQQADRQTRSQQQERERRQASTGRQNPTAAARQKHRSAKKTNSPAPPTPICPGFALLGFVAGGMWGLSLLDGDGKLFGGLVTGVIGAYIAGHYSKVLIAALLVGSGWWVLSQPSSRTGDQARVSLGNPSDAKQANTRLPEISSKLPSLPSTTTSDTKEDLATTDSRRPVPFASKILTPVQKVEQQFPYPPKPDLLLRPHQALKTDPALMRRFQQAIFDYETRTGKSFLNDHPSMQSATLNRFDYFSRYGKDGLLDGQQPIKSLKPTQNLWQYTRPQLWELDLLATVEQHFLYTSTAPSGISRDGKIRSYPGKGLCYQPLNRPFFRDGTRYEPFQIPVLGGDVWRDYVRRVYQAKTDQELLALDPFNLAISKTHDDTRRAKASYETQKQQVDELRRASLENLNLR